MSKAIVSPAVESTAVQVPTRRGWTNYQAAVITLLLAISAINYMDRINLSVVIPTLMKQYSLPPAAVGLLLSIVNWTLVVSLLFSGPLVDRYRPGNILPTGVALWSASTLMTCLSVTVPFLACCRTALGLGESTLAPAAGRLFSELFKKDDQGKAIGIYYAGTKIGLAIGAVVSATILHAYGWQAVFIVTGVGSALWLIPWLLIYRSGKQVIQEAVPASGDGAKISAEKISWVSLFRYRAVWTLMLGMAAYLYVYFVFLTWLPSYLILDRHMSILKTGVFSTFPFLIAVLIGVFSGWLSDRWIRSGASLSTVRKTFVGGGFALSTVFIMIGTHIQAQGLALFCIFMSMGVLGMVSPNINALPLDLAPRSVVSSVVALQQVGGQIGGALAPIVTGILFGRAGNFTFGLVVTGGVALIFGTLVHVFLLGRIEPCIGIKTAAEAVVPKDRAAGGAV